MADRFSADLAGSAGNARVWPRSHRRYSVRALPRRAAHHSGLRPDPVLCEPGAYQVSAVPEKWRGLFLLNPLAQLFEGLRWSLLGEGYMNPVTFLYAALVAGIVFWLGILIFRRAEREFADVI